MFFKDDFELYRTIGQNIKFYRDNRLKINDFLRLAASI